MLGLFDDFLQQPLAVLQVGDLRLVVGQRPSQAEPLVAEGGAGRMRHHHRAQLLLVELEHQDKTKASEPRERKRTKREKEAESFFVCVFYFSHHLMQIVF